jgi:hypothetical protein
MAGAKAEAAGLSGVLRITRVADDLAHVLEHSQTDETRGTWTGLACPDHGLEIGADVDNAILRRLVRGELADLIWEAPPDFTVEHAQLCVAAVTAYQAADHRTAGQLWEQLRSAWSRAWSANHYALWLMQNSGLTRFFPEKPQRWVIASFEHHTGPHGIDHPHIHNIVITALTTGPVSDSNG